MNKYRLFANKIFEYSNIRSDIVPMATKFSGACYAMTADSPGAFGATDAKFPGVFSGQPQA